MVEEKLEELGAALLLQGGVDCADGGMRVLVIPTADAPFTRRQPGRGRPGLLDTASHLLKTRLKGERALYVVSDGEAAQLARSTDLMDLTGRLARAMSAVSEFEGPLAYVKLWGGDSQALHAVEKPLYTNEFEARDLGVYRLGSELEEALGEGAVGVALVATGKK